MKKKYVRMTKEQRELVREYIRKNPDSTYKKFLADTNGSINCGSNSSYSRLRLSLSNDGGRPAKRSYVRKVPLIPGQTRKVARATLYMTLWSYPKEKISLSGMVALKDFVETLNTVRQSRFSIIEMADPAVIEVREAHVRA